MDTDCAGAVTFVMMLLSRVIFRKFGWGVAALITPTVLLITGVAFFGLILFGGTVDPILAKMALTPLFAAVLVGAAQNVFSKSAKYSLFDPCKEMAYIPLDQETQLKVSQLQALLPKASTQHVSSPISSVSMHLPKPFFRSHPAVVLEQPYFWRREGSCLPSPSVNADLAKLSVSSSCCRVPQQSQHMYKRQYLWELFG